MFLYFIFLEYFNTKNFVQEDKIVFYYYTQAVKRMNNTIPSLNRTPVAKLTFIVIAFICTSKCVKRNKLLYCSVYDQFYNRYNHRFGSLLP